MRGCPNVVRGAMRLTPNDPAYKLSHEVVEPTQAVTEGGR